MNFVAMSPRPYLALVDDDEQSARLLTRQLLAHGSPTVHWAGGAAAAAAELTEIMSDAATARPAMVLVDLKSPASATCDFIAALRELDAKRELLIVAMAPALDKDVRDTLIDAGAEAVFQRHSNIEAYRREAASLVSFWVRNQRLHAIGA